MTGAGHGIGRQIAQCLAMHGADVAVNFSRDATGAEVTAEAVREVGRRAMAVRADVSVAGEVKAMVDAVADEFGHLDILVNNAGIVEIAPVIDMTEDSWDRVMDVNLKGHFLCTRAAGPLIVKAGGAGRIINVGSVLGRFPLAGRSAYGASKAAIAMLTQIWALEFAPHGVTVNAVDPGTIESAMTAPILETIDSRARATEPIPLGRIGSGFDIAETVAFLASAAASYVTGVSILIDGGLSMSPKARGSTGNPAPDAGSRKSSNE